MRALTNLSLAEAGKGLEAGDFTAGELTQACIEGLESGRDLNAFITVDECRSIWRHHRGQGVEDIAIIPIFSHLPLRAGDKHIVIV